MSEDHPTAPACRWQARQAYPDFPLFAHAAGVWGKKIRGKMHYFGPWDDPDGALKKYLEQKDALHAGRKPRPDTEALTVKDLANAFLNAQAGAAGQRRIVAADLGGLQAGRRSRWWPTWASLGWSPTWTRRTSPLCGTSWPRSGDRTV